MSTYRIAREHFDEEFYLLSNPDVASAIACGSCTSGWDHYQCFGADEGRRPTRKSVSELENANRLKSERSLDDISVSHSRSNYLTPDELSVMPRATGRVLALGSCQAEWWTRGSWPHECEFYLINNVADVPAAPKYPIDSYEYCVIQLPLATIYPYTSAWKQNSEQEYLDLFEFSTRVMNAALDAAMRWNKDHNILTFVVNFMVPQGNNLGLLLERYSLSNPVFYIEELNKLLYHRVSASKNAFVCDIDRLSASIGRRSIQDDSIFLTSHNSIIPHGRESSARIEPMECISAHYSHVNEGIYFSRAVWSELDLMYRVAKGIDAVKLVVVDLDDTLWNGVSGEASHLTAEMSEGWPTGLMEALAYLKKRGILIAIISKNDHDFIESVWETITQNFLVFSDFACIKINWKNKIENMADILREVNVLPNSVVYIDDNPVERSAMRLAYPTIRTLGKFPFYLRRILLWSSETQVAQITQESSKRTQMVQAQIAREGNRAAVDRPEFLSSLGLKADIWKIDMADPKLDRAIELLNKTNQFNTTGIRWPLGSLPGTKAVYACEARDKFSSYGLIAVAVVEKGRIEQFVMSCRVVGLDIEFAVLNELLGEMFASGARQVGADIVDTGRNKLSAGLFEKAGFKETSEGWSISAGDKRIHASHVAVAVRW